LALLAMVPFPRKRMSFKGFEFSKVFILQLERSGKPWEVLSFPYTYF